MPLYNKNGLNETLLKQTVFGELDGEVLFSLLPPRIVTENDRALYVHQGEIITNLQEDLFDIIGSDDATTCIIILARNPRRYTFQSVI